MAANVIAAVHDCDGRLYAAWDACARHVEPGVRSSRFAAFLAPYASREAAERALIEAGAVIETNGA
jgi:hypothetical protein